MRWSWWCGSYGEGENVLNDGGSDGNCVGF